MSFESIKTLHDIIADSEIKEDYYFLETNVIDNILLKRQCSLPNKISLYLCFGEESAEIDTTLIGKQQNICLGDAVYHATIKKCGEIYVNTDTCLLNLTDFPLHIFLDDFCSGAVEMTLFGLRNFDTLII